MSIRINTKSTGSLGGGCFLLFFALAGWGICALIFPKLPDYEKVMTEGEIVPGEVVRVERVANVTINGRNPRKVFFRYGEGREGSMTLALGESARTGMAIDVRVLEDNAYPEGLRPLAKPRWLNFLFAALGLFAALLLVVGVIRIILLGGVLAVAGHELLKKKNSEKPPPLDSPPPL